MIKYKLTDENYQTYGGCQWGENVTHETSGEGNLCGSGWIHVYDSPELAVLLNPIHAGFDNPVLWKVRVSGKSKTDYGLKSGYTKVTTLQREDIPVVTTEQRVTFAIRCALAVSKDRQFRKWANAWLKGKERSYDAAYAAAANAADDAAYDAGNNLNLKQIAKRVLAEG